MLIDLVLLIFYLFFLKIFRLDRQLILNFSHRRLLIRGAAALDHLFIQLLLLLLSLMTILKSAFLLALQDYDFSVVCGLILRDFAVLRLLCSVLISDLVLIRILPLLIIV